MKKAMLLAAFFLACAPKEEAAPGDSAAMAGPAPLTAADVAGTWSGTTMAEESDSVLSRWTITGDGMNAKMVSDASGDTVAVTTTYDADSLISTSAPYVDKTLPGTPTVTFRSVGRLTGGKLVGTAALMLASKPDSVLVHVRWEGTRSP